MSTASVFTKLNLKDQTEIVVLNAPASFEPELATLRGVSIRSTLPRGGSVGFALAFVTRQAEVDAAARALVRLAEGDALLWFAFPKGSSKRYTCDFNRDTGWAVLGAAGFETVRLVAIDEDWSAMRFRRVEFVKSLTRDPKRALSAQGKRVAKPKR